MIRLGVMFPRELGTDAGSIHSFPQAVEGSVNRRFVTVLHRGPMGSPEKAVRAAIVQEQRESQ